MLQKSDEALNIYSLRHCAVATWATFLFGVAWQLFDGFNSHLTVQSDPRSMKGGIESTSTKLENSAYHSSFFQIDQLIPKL